MRNKAKMNQSNVEHEKKRVRVDTITITNAMRHMELLDEGSSKSEETDNSVLICQLLNKKNAHLALGELRKFF